MKSDQIKLILCNIEKLEGLMRIEQKEEIIDLYKSIKSSEISKLKIFFDD